MTLLTAFYILLLFIGLFIAQEIFYRYPRFSFAFFTIGSIIFFPCWVLLFGVEDWFAWLKVLSIAVGIILLSLFRTTRLGSSALVRYSTYALLAVNIFEAVARDVATGTIANYLNALAGILLIVTLERIDTIRITASKQKDLRWTSITMAWIIGYTIWNWVFVYLNFGLQSGLVHLAVLGSAFAVALVERERWLQARLFTLGTFFMIFHSSPHIRTLLFNGDINETFGFFASLIAAGFMVGYTFFFFRKRFR
ncbi:hypothetical protein IT087_04300 [Candidatus Uhrbacteria bacterium]|nr:hypothetical protein [Candidatus Uhrbacteria bacterium]